MESQKFLAYHTFITERVNEMTSSPPAKRAARQARAIWNSPRIVRLREGVMRWQKTPLSGISILAGGTILVTLLAWAINQSVSFSNPGLIYLPLVAFLAYHWNWRYAASATILQLCCVYFIFTAPAWAIKALNEQEAVKLITLAAVTAFVLAIVQVTRLYRAAQEQTQELNAIFESIADGVVVVDQQGKIARENAAARRIRKALEQSPAGEQILKALLHTPAAYALEGKVQPNTQNSPIVVMDMQRELREYMVSAFSLLKPREERSSGALQQIKQESKSSPEAAAGAVIVWHDVTETRKLLSERQAHAETEARRVLLQTLIDELPSGAYLVRGRDARLVLANRAAAAGWGAIWHEGQPMGEFLAEHGILVLHFDGHTFALAEFATIRALQNGEQIRQQQEIIRRPDGTTLPVLVNAVALQRGALNWSSLAIGEQEPAAIVVHQDMTALKEAERLKDEFIGIAAHELRNPMAVLKGFTHMLISQTARGKGAPLDEWQTEALQDIDQATTRLVELTEDLLDVTRLQAGRVELRLEPINLAALTKRIATRLQITTNKHTIDFSAGDEPMIIEVDAQRIEQVLVNIINNAIKYSPDGGAIGITLQAIEHGQFVQLSVQDHGIGIPMQQQNRIFGRFMRADNARAHGIRGTGLGLYLCRELIERQNGHIWFASNEGVGSTFYISLPLVHDHAEDGGNLLPAGENAGYTPDSHSAHEIRTG